MAITYTYDKNGDRIASEKNSEKLDYIYDTENRLLAIKDKKGHLMAALYDGDDNRVFTASRYHLYGTSKASTNTTGNPFACNGEARDDTGLDYSG